MFLPTYPENCPLFWKNPSPSEENIHFGGEIKSEIVPFFLYGLVTYMTGIFLKKIGQNRSVLPSAVPKRIYTRLCGVATTNQIIKTNTQWSIQRLSSWVTNYNGVNYQEILCTIEKNCKRPSLNSLITLLKILQSLWTGGELGGGGRAAAPVAAIKERLCGCHQGSLYPQLITYHALPSSLVPNCPRLCPAPVQPCDKLLEARPPSKISAGGTPWWSC